MTTAIDWRDSDRFDRLVFEMIDPNNLDESRGFLDGVILSDSKLTYGYLLESRAAGSLAVSGSNYKPNSMIRIHHYVDAWDYHDELGTFFTTTGDMDYASGEYSGTISLISTMGWYTDDKFVSNFVVPAGCDVKNKLIEALDGVGAEYRISGSVSGRKQKATKIYPFGDPKVTAINEMISTLSARVEIDGHGVLLIEPYINPSSREPIFAFDFTASDSVMENTFKRSSDASNIPSRVGVYFKDGDTEITAYADASSISESSRARRGRNVTTIIQPSELIPATNASAAQLANDSLAQQSVESLEFSFNGMYIPIRCGSVVSFHGGDDTCNALMKTREVNLGAGLITGYVIKKVSNG